MEKNQNEFHFHKTINPAKNYQDCEGLDIPSLPHFKIAKAN
jgi:hypothetical protein